METILEQDDENRGFYDHERVLFIQHRFREETGLDVFSQERFFESQERGFVKQDLVQREKIGRQEAQVER